MADNVMKATVDAIAEADNEVAGFLVTRFRASHVHGQDNAEADVGSPTTLTSPVDIFKSDLVGMGLDIIKPAILALTGNEGSYVVATFVDAKNITLDKIDGAAATLITQKPIRWRLATLKVETTLEFKDNDRQMELWVGEEPEPVVYAALDQTPGAQEFLGIGPHRLEVRGSIASGSPAPHWTAARRRWRPTRRPSASSRTTQGRTSTWGSPTAALAATRRRWRPTSRPSG